MASGRIDNGSFSGPRNRSDARPLIVWSSTTNVANNTSSVTATLVFKKVTNWNSWNNYGHNVTITINGNSSTANKTFDIRTAGEHNIWSRTVTVTHNSNGAKSISIGASGDTGVSLGTYNFSQTVNLDTIPRASSLSAFSFNANLKNGTANKINYTVNRKSTSFRHQIQLRDGSTTVFAWDNVSSNGASNIDLTASNVNTLLNRMSSSTTKSFTLRIATRSGVDGGWIGDAVTRSATGTVHADVKPTLSALSFGQEGNSVSDDFLQNISRVGVSFTRSAGYGASITSSSIIVRRVSDKGNSQTMNSHGGTTPNRISLVGTYEVIAQATDSRGRSGAQLRSTFTSVAYSPPVITSFTATRQSNEGEGSKNIDWHRVGIHSGLSGKNSATGLVEYRRAGGTWTQIESIKDAAGSWSKKGTVKGLSETSSYEFRFTLTDSLGYSRSQTVSVTTARVVLDIHKNEGVGIGKLHEYGVLDVDGPASFGHTDFNVDGFVPIIMRVLTSSERTGLIQGSDPSGTTAWQIGNRLKNSRSLYLEATSSIRLTTGKAYINNDEIAESGTHANGDWVRFYDGTQICWNTVNLSYKDPSHLELFWTYPVDFINDRTSGSFIRDTYWGGFGERLASPTIWHGSTSAQIRLWAPQGATWGSSSTVRGTVFAIGRWK